MKIDEINLKGKIKQRDIIKVEFKNKKTDGLYMVVSNNGLIITGIKLSTESWLIPNAPYLHTGFFADKEKKKERLANIFGGFSLISYNNVKSIVGRVEVKHYKKICESMYRFMLGQYNIEKYTIILKPYANRDMFFDKDAPTILPITKKSDKHPPTNVKQYRQATTPTASHMSTTIKRQPNPLDKNNNKTIVNPTDPKQKYPKYYQANNPIDRLDAIFEYFGKDDKIPLFYVYNILIENKSARVTSRTIYVTKGQILDYMTGGKTISKIFLVEGSSYIDKYKKTINRLLDGSTITNGIFLEKPIQEEIKEPISASFEIDTSSAMITKDEEVNERIKLLKSKDSGVYGGYYEDFRRCNCKLSELYRCVKGDFFPAIGGYSEIFTDPTNIRYRILASKIIGGLEPFEIFDFNSDRDKKVIEKICNSNPALSFEFLCTNTRKAKSIIIAFIALNQDYNYIHAILNKYDIPTLIRKAISPFYEMAQGEFYDYEEAIIAFKKKFKLQMDIATILKDHKLRLSDNRIKPGCKLIFD